MRRTYAFVAIAFVAGLVIGYFARSAGIRTPRGEEAHATELAAIEKLHQEDIEATLSQDAKGLIDIWAEDAVRTNPAGPPAVGNQAIQAENQKFHSQHPGFKVLSYVPKYKNIQIEEGLACEEYEREGEYKLSSESPAVKWHAKGVEVLKRLSDGSWKFAVILWNE